jgi:hypothetical protein
MSLVHRFVVEAPLGEGTWAVVHHEHVTDCEQLVE